jgi:hypothetical protein
MQEASTPSQRPRALLIPLDDHEALLALRDFDRRSAEEAAGAEHRPLERGASSALGAA